MTRQRPYIIALTGSIGMGKSTTATMFADHGIAVWDADRAVHDLYDTGGAAVEPIRALHPDAVVSGRIDRARLKDWIAADPDALKRIEAVVHPLVAADRAAFIDAATTDIVLVDVPLLFETGGEGIGDLVVVVSAPASVQRDRVLSRPGMTEPQLDAILAKQMPDAEKRKRADVVIDTTSMEPARDAVRRLVTEIRERLTHA